MPTVSTFVCKKTIERLDYVAVRTGHSVYHVVKYRDGLVPNAPIGRGTVISDVVHKIIISYCKVGHMVLDAKACGFEVNEANELVGDF